MSGFAPRKQERDYSKEVADLVPQVTKLAEAGQVQEALDKLMALEKQTRNAADLSSTSTILTTAATLAYKSSNYPLLNSTVTVLAKRHGQLKEAVVRMIDEVITFLPEIKTQAGELTWLDALKSLRNITDGKIYLELQRARLTVLLSRYHEKAAETAPPPPADAPPKPPAPKVKPATTADKEPEPEPVTSKDHLERAADLLSDLQVETFSSMDKREKTEFILDQMRLESGRDNWTRVRVGSRKINRKYLKEEGNADLKLRYYALVIALALEEDAFLDACKSYQEVYDTPGIKADEAKSQEALEMIASYVVLAPYDNEQSDMLHKLDLDPAMKKVSLHHDLLKSFTTPELKRWPAIESLYGPTLRQSTVFDQSKKGAFRWEELHKRVIEHNIRTVAGYYTRITLDRLSALLDLPLAQTETTLAALVVDKTVYARIDRPAGVVDFTKKKASDEVLDGWSGDVAKLLGLIEATSHLVNKEYAVHAAIKVSA